MSNVRCKYIEAENCVLINVTADRIVAKPYSIIYNVLDDAEGSATLVVDGLLQLTDKEVVVGVFDNDGKQFVVRSTTDIDGGNLIVICVTSYHFFTYILLYFYRKSMGVKGGRKFSIVRRCIQWQRRCLSSNFRKGHIRLTQCSLD